MMIQLQNFSLTSLYMRMSRKIKSFVMDLWISWWNIVCLLRPAFSRARTFLWFLLVLAAFSVRNDLLGVSSFVRALGLSEHFYEHLLHFFHSNAVKTDRLADCGSPCPQVLSLSKASFRKSIF